MLANFGGRVLTVSTVTSLTVPLTHPDWPAQFNSGVPSHKDGIAKIRERFYVIREVAGEFKWTEDNRIIRTARFLVKRRQKKNHA